MKTIHYQIQFYSYWHIGSGLTSGADTDAEVLKNRKGLPYIPGKTLKGLFREAAEYINSLHPNLVTTDFIRDIMGDNEAVKFERKEAVSFFSNAELSNALINGLQNSKDIQFLYKRIASTAIDENGQVVDKTEQMIDRNGQAVDHSLRKTQVTIPLSLYATVENFPDNTDYHLQLVRCFQFIKRMGTKRNRGLGRCEITIK